jgi:hypothetical protein
MCFDVSWIAPEAKGLPALGWLGELGQLAQIEGVRVHTCTGQFTRQQLAAELRRRARVKLWTGHGTAGGLLAPDGTLIRPKWLATQAKVGLPQVVVLAACASQERDDELHSMAEEISRAGVNVIGFPAGTEDAAAVAFNVELVRALASGARLGDAFDVALEEIGHTRTARGVFLAGGLMNGYSDVVNRLETLEAGQRELKDGIGLIMEHLGIGERATCK